MPTFTFEFPPDVFAALRKSPDEFCREMRIAAAVEWYAEGIVSQGKAAQIAGLSRAAFLDELGRRRVAACQGTAEELAGEVERD